MVTLDDILKISIKDYLNGIGIETRKEGSRYFASSPFSRDTNWSFCVYPTNTYFDWANGHGGSIINLYSRINNVDIPTAVRELKKGITYEKYKPNYKQVKEQQRSQEPFNYEKYINKDPKECEEIKAYAASRGITEGYFCGVFFSRSRGSGSLDLAREWVRVPALGFLHVDKDLKPCGAKFRKIRPSPDYDQSPRFSARGNLGFYILSHESNNPLLNSPVLYVVESESSANSLWMFLKERNIPCVILSRGGVSSAPTLTELPAYYGQLTKKVIIDYDGSEELYQQRIKLYEGLGAEPIKMILPKGEDINSLYCKGEMWKIENLVL